MASALYTEVKNITEGMEVGELSVIPVPENLKAFRKYLSEISRKQDKRFTTKVVGNQLHIMRVKYSNIYSQIVE